MDVLPIDVVGNIILKFLSINDFNELGLTSKHYHKLTKDLYFYHVKPRIVNDSIVFPQKVDTILSGEQLWKLYQMFHQVQFSNEHNHWFRVTLDFDHTNGNKKHIINPLLWYRTNIETNRKYSLFKHITSYYTGIGLYNHLSFQIKAIGDNSCYGKINLSYIPFTIDTIAINMNHQQNIIYYFSNNEYDAKHNDTLNEEKEDYENKNDDKIYLWKNIFIGGGKFIDDTLDCYDIQKYVKSMDEKLINGFDELVYKMNYKCIHLLFNNNKLKTVKNIDKLHRYIGNLQITNQLDWNASLKNINLSNYKRLTKINLSGNNLKGNINDFVGCLPKCLKMLNMNHNKDINGCLDFKILFYDNNLNEIEQIVITNCNLNGIKNFNMYLPKSLKVLCLNYNNIEVNWNVEFKLMDILKTESKLERLSLCNNKINGNISLQEMEQWMPYNLYLIDLNKNNLNGIVNLNYFPAHMEEFDISDNNIQQIIGLDLIQKNPDQFAGFTYDLDVQYSQ